MGKLLSGWAILVLVDGFLEERRKVILLFLLARSKASILTVFQGAGEEGGLGLSMGIGIEIVYGSVKNADENPKWLRRRKIFFAINGLNLKKLLSRC